MAIAYMLHYAIQNLQLRYDDDDDNDDDEDDDHQMMVVMIPMNTMPPSQQRHITKTEYYSP